MMAARLGSASGTEAFSMPPMHQKFERRRQQAARDRDIGADLKRQILGEGVAAIDDVDEAALQRRKIVLPMHALVAEVDLVQAIGTRYDSSFTIDDGHVDVVVAEVHHEVVVDFELAQQRQNGQLVAQRLSDA